MSVNKGRNRINKFSCLLLITNLHDWGKPQYAGVL